MAHIQEVCWFTPYTWYFVTRVLSYCIETNWAEQLLISLHPERVHPYLEVVQRLHFHDWSQSVEGQRDINTLVWHQRRVNGQGGARDDPEAGQEKKTEVMTGAQHCPTPILLSPGTSWLMFLLPLSCRCCYSGEEHSSPCAPQQTLKAGQGTGKSIRLVSLTTSTILPRGPASGNVSIPRTALVYVLSSSLPSKERHLDSTQACGLPLRELQSTRSRVYHTLHGCHIIGSHERKNWSQHRTNTSPRRSTWFLTEHYRTNESTQPAV